MKHFLHDFFTKNVGWKLLSLAAAAIFWIAAVNIIDPTMKKSFANIPVEILNESVITSSNQVYEVVSGDTVDVTITSKRSFVERLTADDFTASADLTELSSVNAVSIRVKLNRAPANTSYELDWGNAVLKVSLEKRVTEKFKVTVDAQGDLGEGYVLSSAKSKPNIVEVSGGESKIKKIDHVGVNITLNGQTDDFSTTAKPLAYDAYGDLIDAANISFGVDEVKVSVVVSKTMDVPIEITTIGEPAEGYHLIQTDRQPESVKVSASDASLLTSDLKITLEVDIEGATEDVEKEIDISGILGPEYTIEDDVTVVAVRCEIGQSGRRTLYLTPSDIEVRNLPDNHTITFADDSERYVVNLTGSDSALRGVDITDLGAYIDISGFGDGIHDVEVGFDLPTGVRLTGTLTVRIVLSEQAPDEGDETEETPTPEPEQE